MSNIIQFLHKNMIWAVLVLMLVSIALGNYYHEFFVSLKAVLPVALFLMLYKPMTYLDIGKAFTKRTDIKTKYLAVVTFFYIVLFPVTAYLLVKLFLFLMPSINPAMLAGLVILSLSPIATSAPAFVGMANGKVQLTLVGVIYTFCPLIVCHTPGIKAHT